MFGLGFSEMLVLGVIALVVVGPNDLPKLARSLGRLMNEVKRGGETFKQELEQSARDLRDDVESKPAALPPVENTIHTDHTQAANQSPQKKNEDEV